MSHFKLLLMTIYLSIALSGCTSEVSGVSTETAQPVAKPCLPKSSSNSTFHISPTGNSSLSRLRLEIEEYLNSGGSASGLQSLTLDDQNNTIGSITEVDLNDDKINEIVLSTTTSDSVEGHLSGWVGVYSCKLGKYHASYAELGQFIEYAKVDAVLDLLDTGTPQIYVEYKWEGMGCQVGLQVLALSSDKWSWAFGNFLNCPATVSMSVNKATGKTEIIYKGILRDVIGNEPDEEVTQIFAVENGEFQLQP